jgi:hypothetical protein
MQELQPLDDAAVIRLPGTPTDQDILDGVHRWLKLLAAGDYATAVRAFYFKWGRTPESLRSQIEEFFGTEYRSTPDQPSENVLSRSEVYREGIPNECVAVVGFFVPLVNGLGIWTTALVRQHGNSAIFEFEIFHL